MKTIHNTRYPFLTLIIVLLTFSGFSQDNPAKRASPPATATGKIGAANITINYSSPYVKGRKIWGDLVPYDKVWRAGANEATVFETDKDLMVEGKLLPAGKYAFFTIPGEKEWVVIFNKTADQWGAFKYDESMDALRVTVKPKEMKNSTESLVYTIHDNGISLVWEKLEVPVMMRSK